MCDKVRRMGKCVVLLPQYYPCLEFSKVQCSNQKKKKKLKKALLLAAQCRSARCLDICDIEEKLNFILLLKLCIMRENYQQCLVKYRVTDGHSKKVKEQVYNFFLITGEGEELDQKT